MENTRLQKLKARLLAGALVLTSGAALVQVETASAATLTPVAWRTDNVSPKVWPDIPAGTVVPLQLTGCQEPGLRVELLQWYRGSWIFVGGYRGASASNISYTPPLGTSDAIIHCFDFTIRDAEEIAGIPVANRTPAVLINSLIVSFSTFRPGTQLSTEYRSLNPGRLLDTRSGGTTVDGKFAGGGVRQSRSELQLEVAGRHGIPGDAKAVSMNVTVTGVQAGGFITVYPCGTGTPDASNVNFSENQTIPNAVVSQVGVGGKVCFYTFGVTNLIVDANGYFPQASTFVPRAPARLMDTRATGATVDRQFERIGQLAKGTFKELQIGGRNGIPTGAKSVALNVTVTGGTESGFATVFPCGGVPDASNLNFDAGQTIANMVIASLSARGTICVFTSGTTDMIVDVNGYLPSTSPWVPLVPGRLMDTRSTGSTVDRLAEREGPISYGQVRKVPIVGRYGIPVDATTVMLNITVAGALSAGYLSVYPCNGFVPNASNLNYSAGSTIPNAVIAQISDLGEICIFSEGLTDVIVDVSGYLNK